ncbi:MAG: NUDIX hydrolase [Terriglobales bacterium]
MPIKREYPDAPIAGVGAVIIDHGRVLLVRRGNPPMIGEWSIPGGAVELGETVLGSVIREVREETGMVVEPMALLGVYDRIIRGDEGRILYHYVLIDFLCIRIAGEPQAASDCKEAKWFTSEEVKRIPLSPDTIQVIHLGFEKAGK